MTRSFPAFSLILPAAGSGKRLGGDIRKQFLEFEGKSLLRWSLEPFMRLPAKPSRIVIVLPKDEMHLAESLLEGFDFPFEVAEGGAERADSVMNGLKKLESATLHPEEICLVHDAARPLVKTEDIRNLLLEIQKSGDGGILAARAKDTLKRDNGIGYVAETLDRNHVWHALTPQGAPFNKLMDAYQFGIQGRVKPTDEAGMLEMAGYEVMLVPGDSENFKVTTPSDLTRFAHALLLRNAKN